MQSTANEHSVIVLKNNYMHINVDLPPCASAARRFNGSKSHFNVAVRQCSKYIFFFFCEIQLNVRPFQNASLCCGSAALQRLKGKNNLQHRQPNTARLSDSLPGGVTRCNCSFAYLQASSGNDDCRCLHSLPRGFK